MNKEYLSIFKKNDLIFGRLVSSSKSLYRKKYPNHKVIFNARIYTKDDYEKYKNTDIKDWFKGQELEIWYGDLDLTLDKNKLLKISKELNQNFVITNELGTYIEEF